ncbi:PREDICTED: hexosaminidase D-like isoform X2 [Papilio polytes]|uniref:hexosaminidase D-like isoform X2 n=1 Tax=Papilio polytes TaxID=76194 RepID=UPI000675D433|nr:PREDICTED: hexosaminidase D-like isoform X2 [Papilio polytes]
MDGIVHFDFKGAPLKINYLETVFKNIKTWGATGVLLEWEDTFPYASNLKDIGSQRSSVGAGGDGLYSIDDVQTIFRLAKENSLEVIQLIQTIGHMEFVLKHPSNSKLREAPHSPAVLCPTNPESLPLVTSMLQQALDAQPDSKYIHIGADEVWHCGECAQCRLAAGASAGGAAALYLRHIQNVALLLKKKKPDLIVLMWEDMLRSMTADVLKSYNLGDLVQPVVWHYNPIESFSLSPAMWETYRQTFPKVWIASAYKGANGGSQVVSPVGRYVSNHEGWLKEIDKYAFQINFVGIIFTGWSRYDHYSTLCELLPVSLPSLKSCLRIFLKRNTSLPMEESEEVPESELSSSVQRYVDLKDRCHNFLHSDQVATWFNRWQIENEFTNPLQIQNVMQFAKHLLTDILVLQETITPQLHAVTGRRSADEWIGTFLRPLILQLSDIYETAVRRMNAGASVLPKCIDF